MTGTEQVVLKIDRYNKLRNIMDNLELAEAKSRMDLEEANQRIEQLEELLHEVNRFTVEYAPFNSAMAKIQKMIRDGLHEES